jgi:hypothetical protein
MPRHLSVRVFSKESAESEGLSVGPKDHEQLLLAKTMYYKQHWRRGELGSAGQNHRQATPNRGRDRRGENPFFVTLGVTQDVSSSKAFVVTY